MSDLIVIDRDELIDEIYGIPTAPSCYLTVAESRAAFEIKKKIINLINNASVVDAEPVKRGRWVREELAPPSCMFCSECGFPKKRGAWNFCPNCGAIMEVEE